MFHSAVLRFGNARKLTFHFWFISPINFISIRCWLRSHAPGDGVWLEEGNANSSWFMCKFAEKTFLKLNFSSTYCTRNSKHFNSLDLNEKFSDFISDASHIFHLIWIHTEHHFKPQELMRCLTRTSSLVEEQPWSCSNAPNGGFSIRPKSSGICCQCPYGYAPNACGCSLLAWWGSRDPLGCLASSRRLSWYGALCYRWRIELGQHHGSHGE